MPLTNTKITRRSLTQHEVLSVLAAQAEMGFCTRMIAAAKDEMAGVQHG